MDAQANALCSHFYRNTKQNFRFTSKIRTLLRFPLGDIVITIRKRVCRRRRQVKQPSKNEQKSHYRYTKQKEKTRICEKMTTELTNIKKQDTHKNREANRVTL